MRPPAALAFGFAKFGTGAGLSRDCQAAAKRIPPGRGEAPVHGGGDRPLRHEADGAIGRARLREGRGGGRLLRELPGAGICVALKADDGGSRAAEAMMAGLVHHFLSLRDEERGAVEELAQPLIRNWNGIEVGRYRVAPDLLR